MVTNIVLVKYYTKSQADWLILSLADFIITDKKNSIETSDYKILARQVYYSFTFPLIEVIRPMRDFRLFVL